MNEFIEVDVYGDKKIMINVSSISHVFVDQNKSTYAQVYLNTKDAAGNNIVIQTKHSYSWVTGLMKGEH